MNSIWESTACADTQIMEINDVYRGREHSYIKHELLKGYLEKLLLIVGTKGTKEITYVDCFAGPWGSDEDSLAGTSIAISLEILEGVRKKLISPPHNKAGLRLRAVYVEENNERHKRLSNYLNSVSMPGIECHALHGDYSELQDDILRLCGQGFAFFFIDPLGWTDVTIPKLGKLAKRPRSEFLINFMYDFINRFINKDELRPQVTAILGELDESDFFKIDALDSKAREVYVVRRYREQLKAAVGSEGTEKARAYHARVMDREKERTKYHLVYLTRHPKGIVEFAEQSEKVDLIQKVVRIQTKRNASHQNDLFAAEDEAERQDADRVELAVVKEYWLSMLESDPAPFDNAVLADMLEETGWLIRDIQKAFGELLAEGKVQNVDAPRKRPIHFVHFDKAERLRRIK